MKSKKILIIGVLTIVLVCIALIGLVGCKDSDSDYINSYTMSVELDMNGKIARCVTDIDLRLRDDLTDGKLELLMNSGAFSDKLLCEKSDIKEAYPKGESYGKVTIVRAEEKGKEIAATLDGNVLSLDVADSNRAGKKTSISVEYVLELPYTTLRYGYNDFSINLANFYPQYARIEEYNVLGDPFYSYPDNYSVSVSYPKGMSVLASGDSVDTVIDGDRAVQTFKATNCRDFAIVLSQMKKIITQQSDGVTVNYMYSEDVNPEKTLALAVDSIKVFSELFGAYTRKTFNVCETQFLHGGMEYSGLIYVSSAAKGLTKDIVVIHEAAHQWWYDAIGSDQINHAWQDEGLTEFSVYLYYLRTDKAETANKLAWNAASNMNAIRDTAADMHVPIDERIERELSDFESGIEYTYNAYIKGFLMFKYVYESLGHDKFIAAIRSYFDEHAFKGNVVPADLLSKLEVELSGITLIINAWLDGKITALY